MNPSQVPEPIMNLPQPVQDEAPVAAGAGVVPQTDAGPATTQSPDVPPVGQSLTYGDELSAHQIQAVEQAVRAGIDDPRKLTTQLDEIRAEYIAGRFGKELKRRQDTSV